MYSRSFLLIDPSSDSSSIDGSSIDAKIYSYSSALCLFSNKTPSSKCETVIMSPVFFIRWCSICNIQDWWLHHKCLSIYTLCVCKRTRKCFLKYNVMWRNSFPCTRYVDEVTFMMLCNSNKVTPKTLLVLMIPISRLSVNVCSWLSYKTWAK